MNRMTTMVCGLALIVLLCGAASAATIYVPDDHATIQAAVNNAAAGDTIFVYNGTYNENVKIGTSHLTLEGEGADVVTVTAAALNDPVFNVTADYVNITGFNATGATDDAVGVCLWHADHCDISDNIASGNGDGIGLYISSDNTLTGNDCSGNDDGGIGLYISSDNNTLTGNDCSGNDRRGIILYDSCDNNTLTENDCSDSGVWGFCSDETSHDNTVDDLTVASYPTTISFTYENGIVIKGVETAPSDPAGKANIGKYVNATNVTADSLLSLNVSYDESDLAGVDESSLRMWRHNGTAWSVVAGSGVNVVENYVYATITEFSVFAPMGDPEATPVYQSPNIHKMDGVEGCVDPDDQITYTICYDNLANPTRGVTNVVITDTLPTGVTFVSASDSGTHAAGVVTWNVGDLDGNAQEACVTLNVTVNTGTEGQTLKNCASIDSDETDPAEACVDTVVCDEPTSYNPLDITKTDDASGCVDPDDQITYTICYDNLANPTQGVTNVVITDTLPAGVTFVSASDSGTHAAGVVTWNVGDLDGNAQEACVTLNVTVNTGTEGQTLENCASIDSDETDPAEACEHTVVCEATPPPTPAPTPINYEPVPAATPLGVVLMIGLLAVAGSVMLRRRE